MLQGMCLLILLLGLGFAETDPPPTQPASPPPAPTSTPGIAVAGYRQAEKVAILPVTGMIDGVTLYSLERRIERAVKDGNTAIVLEIDTPGGIGVATLDICHLIKTDAPANTIAWVRPQAYSAGVIIALACRETVMSPNSYMGDAAPIDMRGVPIPAAERAKAEAPLLAEVIDSARKNRYDENLVQSFVSVGVELWMVEHRQTGQRAFVDRQEYLALFGEEPPATMTPVAPPATTTGEVQPRINDITVNPETWEEQIEFHQTRPSARQNFTSDDRDDWQPIMQVIASDRLLTIDEDEAVYYGLAVQIIKDDAGIAAFFGTDSTKLTRYDRTWSEYFVRFLNNMWVRGALIVIFIIALFLELAAPGMGVFGATAFVALLLLLGAPFLAGLAQWWDILLIVLGLLLIAVEIFIIPGFGVSGIAGALCLLVGMVGTFISGDLDTAQGQQQLGTGLITTLTAMFAAGVGLWLLSRQLEGIPLLNRLILKSEVADQQPGAQTGLLSAMGSSQQRALSPGDEGIAETDMRPAGRAQINGRLVDVKSVGTFIDKGATIRVVSVGRFVIEVEEVEP